MDFIESRHLLNSQTLRSELFYSQETESTNDWAKNWVKSGNSDAWAVFVTDYQTRGRGQYSRSWQAKKGDALLFSIAYRTIESTPIASLRFALAVLNTLKEYIQKPVFIKWPNDLVVDKRKISGILVEQVSSPQKSRFIVAGCGLNLFSYPNSKTIKLPATDLSSHTSISLHEDSVLRTILNHWLILSKASDEDIIFRVNQHLYHKKRVVNVRLNERSAWQTFTIDQVNGDGSLSILSNKGVMQKAPNGSAITYN